MRITAQLIEAGTRTHIWAERYDRAIDDIFAVQDEITISTVAAIEPNLRQAEIERAKRKRPDNLDAYDLVIGARSGRSHANLVRRLGNDLLNRVAGYLTERPVPDRHGAAASCGPLPA